MTERNGMAKHSMRTFLDYIFHKGGHRGGEAGKRESEVSDCHSQMTAQRAQWFVCETVYYFTWRS